MEGEVVDRLNGRLPKSVDRAGKESYL
jgi:hypothetical protein